MGALDRNPDAVLAYGACRYIDGDGAELWVSSAGVWAPRILKWGPDLIPQPGMLVRRTAWDRVGGVDESMRFAFDLDLLLKIQPLGEFIDVGQVVSSFRWHGDSLTVSDRATSLHESEVARRRALSPVARRLAWVWEGPVRVATRAAANESSIAGPRESAQGQRRELYSRVPVARAVPARRALRGSASVLRTGHLQPVALRPRGRVRDRPCGAGARRARDGRVLVGPDTAVRHRLDDQSNGRATARHRNDGPAGRDGPA